MQWQPTRFACVEEESLERTPLYTGERRRVPHGGRTGIRHHAWGQAELAIHFSRHNAVHLSWWKAAS